MDTMARINIIDKTFQVNIPIYLLNILALAYLFNLQSLGRIYPWQFWRVWQILNVDSKLRRVAILVVFLLLPQIKN